MDKKKGKNREMEGTKILIFGLDNSGKTSIVLSLKQNVNLMDYYNTSPTRGMERKFHQIGHNHFIFFDFGGQEQYRKSHLEEINNFLTGVDKIFYVIDVQDPDRYDLSLAYLKDIIDIIKNIEENYEFSIFLHKYDPNLEENERFKDGKLIKELTKKIRNIIPNSFNCGIYKSSIYTVFRKTAHLMI